MEQLIQKVQLISEKYQILAKETGKNFNIFEIAHINTDEVRLCRVLNELINPNGKHCLGRLYLDLFLKIVLKINPEKLKSPVVEREKVIERLRRIDICITDNSSEAPICIPIEVKINAGDQEAQLYDYAKKSHGFGGVKVYYLTKYGDKPSKDSRGNLKDSEIGCISWSEDILNWLNACICCSETISRAPIREILQQFKIIVQKFTETYKENEVMEIENLILENEDNCKNAEKIVFAYKLAKENTIKHLYNRLCSELPNYMREECGKDWWKISFGINNTISRQIVFEYEHLSLRTNHNPENENLNNEDSIIFDLKEKSYFELKKQEEELVKLCKDWIETMLIMETSNRSV